LKITAQVDTYVSAPWGAAVTIKAGEIKQVGDDLGYECIQAGCTEIKDVTPEPKPEPEPEPKPKKAALKKKEADS
jgi:hypothetical protein